MADLGDFTRYVEQYQAATAADGDEPAAPQDTFTWFGQTIRIANDIGPMPFLQFADAASAGLGADDMDGLAAMYAMLRECIDERDFATFRTLATKNRVTGDALLEVVGGIIEAATGRPTVQPSSSLDGSPSTSTMSPSRSSSTVVDLPSLSTAEKVARDLRVAFPPESRPDLREALRLVDEPLDVATG